MAERDPELKDAKGQKTTSLKDRVLRGPESPYNIAKNINGYLTRLAAEEGKQFHYRRAKDFTMRHKFRMQRFAGLTHDFPTEEEIKPQLTPMEEMQRNATLPESVKESRFAFPHLLSYKVGKRKEGACQH